MHTPVNRRTRSTVATGAALLTALVLAACSTADTPTSPTGLRSVSGRANNSPPTTGFVRVCKSAGPVGTYTFQTTVNGGGAHLVNFGFGSTVDIAFAGTEVCLNTYVQLAEPAWEAGQTAEVTLAELVPEGISVAKIEVWNYGVFPAVLLQTVTGANSATVTVNATSKIKVLFFNQDAPPPPPPGGEGCTPGFWKNPKHFDRWTGYTPGQTVGSVFSNAALHGLGSATLLQGLSFQGGSTLAGAAEILLRASIAAVLNSASPDLDYAMTTAQIVTAVQSALASGDRENMLGLAAVLDAENNAGCLLD